MPGKVGSFFSRVRQPVSLRAHLIVLILAVVIPVVLFSVWLVLLFDHQQRQTFERGATERTRAISTAVDAELRSSIATLEALASSRNLDIDNFGRFYNEAVRVEKSQPGWFTLSLASPRGQQFFDVDQQLGAELPNLSEDLSFLQVVRTAKPAVGSLTVAPTKQRLAFTVSVPVIRGNAIKYVLTAVINPQSIDALVSAQKLPRDWIGAVLDRNTRFVSRTVYPDRYVGELESVDIRTALDRAPQGWFQGRSIDRRRVYTGYTRSPFSGWTVALTVPAAVVDASFREAILSVAMLGLFLLALAIAAGWLVSSKVISSIRSLAGMAEDLGLGNQSEPLPRPVSGSLPSAIAEFRDLREALMKANRLIQERSHERDRVEAALRRVSERLELAQEAAGVGAYERDLATGRIEWSASQESLYGLQPGTFGGTKADWASRVHPGDIDRVEAAVHRAAETRAPLATEFRIFRSDGAERWVASQARVMLDEAGSPGRLVGVNIDITDRKRAEEALRQADRNKDEFIAMLGHELRNPLAVISTAIQLLAREAPEDPKLQELCDTIERQIFQMSRLLEDLLDVSRIARGQIRLQKEPCDLSAIVRDVVEDHRPIFERTGIDLVLQLQERTLWVVGDVTRLAQIVGNLLQNANKFTDTGGRVTVQLRRSSDNRAAVLTVRDTGIGMDAETLARAFEPFMQANRSIERSRGGIGLGLALVKGLVELHEGRLSAFSDGLDHGSAFTIRLPSTRLPADQAVETEMAGTVKVLSAKIH